MSDSHEAILRGRTHEQVLADARAYGVDLTLVEYSRRLSVEERIRLLDENVAFIEEIRRNRRRRLAASTQYPYSTQP